LSTIFLLLNIFTFRFVQEKTIALCTEWLLNEYQNNSELETSLKSRHQLQKLFDLKYINQLLIGVENQVTIII